MARRGLLVLVGQAIQVLLVLPVHRVHHAHQMDLMDLDVPVSRGRLLHPVGQALRMDPAVREVQAGRVHLVRLVLLARHLHRAVLMVLWVRDDLAHLKCLDHR